jgi:hypothetical protein
LRASCRGASQVVEDAADDLWLGDERDYAHLFTAAGMGSILTEKQ